MWSQNVRYQFQGPISQQNGDPKIVIMTMSNLDFVHLRHCDITQYFFLQAFQNLKLFYQMYINIFTLQSTSQCCTRHF